MTALFCYLKNVTKYVRKQMLKKLVKAYSFESLRSHYIDLIVKNNIYNRPKL